MKIEESFEIDVPIQQMFDSIDDVEQIGYCIAGVKQVTAINSDESKWKVEARAGFMARTLNLTGRIIERRSPEYLAFTGAGQDVELFGHVMLTALGPSRTRCLAVVDANVVGALAPLIDLMAKGPQQALIQTTIGNIRNRLNDAAAISTAQPSDAVAADVKPRTLLQRATDWLRRLFRA